MKNKYKVKIYNKKVLEGEFWEGRVLHFCKHPKIGSDSAVEEQHLRGLG